MFEYYEQFSQFIDIPLLIWGGIKFALLAFIIALVGMLFCKRWILVFRQNVVLKYFAYSYYFFIPVICLCIGFVYGGVTSSRDQIIDRLPTYKVWTQSLIDYAFGSDLLIMVENTHNEYISDQTLEQVYTQTVVMAISQLNDTATDNPSKKIIVSVLTSSLVTNYAKDQFKQQIVSISNLDDDLVDEIIEIKISEIFTADTVIKIFAFYINQIAAMVLTKVKIIWGLLLFFPLLEIVLANYFRRQYLKHEAQQKANYSN